MGKSRTRSARVFSRRFGARSPRPRWWRWGGSRGAGSAAAADFRELSGAVPAAVPLHAGEELDERSERARLLQGRVPPLLPAQPVRLAVGPHVLGSRRQPRPRALEAPAGRDPGAGRRAGVLRQRGGRPPQHQRLRHAPNPPMVAIYTAAKPGEQEQSLAYSTDRGRTFTSTPATPCSTSARREFRDPKVFWYEPEREWRMVVVEGRPAQGRDLPLAGPQAVDASQRLRAGQRGRRRLGVPGPVPARGRRQAQARPSG